MKSRARAIGVGCVAVLVASSLDLAASSFALRAGLRLRDEGRVPLDAPASTYLPELRPPDGVFPAAGGLYTSLRDDARYVAFNLAAYPPRDDPEVATSRVISRTPCCCLIRRQGCSFLRAGLTGVDSIAS